MSSGETRLLDVPVPKVSSNDVLIQATKSLISVGTEKMLVEFGRAGWLQKARQQPEKVKMVLEKAKTDGVATTFGAVRSKLDQPLSLGYCHVGRIVEVGSKVASFAEGDRVVSNGSHASLVSVPQNLCAKIPEGLSDDRASFTVLGAIGLQGIRLANPTLGEVFVVTGLGLIGLLTVQLLKAQGCEVIGIDYDEAKLELARSFGAETVSLSKGEDPGELARALTSGAGVDGVIITASTSSSDPMSQAARMCRKRGRIVLVGVTGLELNRAEFYEKELSFQVSCSYGPGRYDPQYEAKGQDYPIGFVRWTAQRNFQAILALMKSGRLNVEPLISHRFDFENAEQAYEKIGPDASVLGVVLSYPELHAEELTKKTVRLRESVEFAKSDVVCGFLGAGNYSSRVLMPAFDAANAKLHTVVSGGGVSGTHHGRKNGFMQSVTDEATVFENKDINTVVIATRHNTHAGFVVDAINTGKNVFVEKPLGLTDQEIDDVESAYLNQVDKFEGRLMVGFNRRFAPHVVKMKELLDTVKEPKTFLMLMNAGAIPSDHWTQDVAVGGGRIIGEACHYIDLMRHLAGSEIVSVAAQSIGKVPGVDITEDKATITLEFGDGSFGSIHYLASGSSKFPKERIEAFAAGKVLQLNNFMTLKGFGWSTFKGTKSWRQDKGQFACAKAFVDSIREGKPSPIPAQEIFEASRAAIKAAEILRTR